MAAFADDKDWTWVIDQPCDECGFDAGSFEAEQVAPMIRANAAAWLDVLAGDADALRVRTRADRWSPIEYAFHVRDVFELYHYRLGLMLERDGPHYPNWDQDAAATAKDYRNGDAGAIATELELWSGKLADLFDTVRGADWHRTGYRSDGAEFTVERFAKYLIHDPVHHLWDVGGT